MCYIFTEIFNYPPWAQVNMSIPHKVNFIQLGFFLIVYRTMSHHRCAHYKLDPRWVGERY